jgi:hypothetical protein
MQLCFVSVHGPRETYFVDEPRTLFFSYKKNDMLKYQEMHSVAIVEYSFTFITQKTLRLEGKMCRTQNVQSVFLYITHKNIPRHHLDRAAGELGLGGERIKSQPVPGVEPLSCSPYFPILYTENKNMGTCIICWIYLILPAALWP